MEMQYRIDLLPYPFRYEDDLYTPEQLLVLTEIGFGSSYYGTYETTLKKIGNRCGLISGTCNSRMSEKVLMTLLQINHRKKIEGQIHVRWDAANWRSITRGTVIAMQVDLPSNTNASNLVGISIAEFQKMLRLPRSWWAPTEFVLAVFLFIKSRLRGCDLKKCVVQYAIFTEKKLMDCLGVDKKTMYRYVNRLQQTGLMYYRHETSRKSLWFMLENDDDLFEDTYWMVRHKDARNTLERLLDP